VKPPGAAPRPVGMITWAHHLVRAVGCRCERVGLRVVSEKESVDRDPGDKSEAEASTDEGPTPEVTPPTAARRPLRPALLGIDTSALLAMSEAVKNLQVNLIAAVRVPIPDVSRFVLSLPALEALRRPLVDPNILKIAAGEPPMQAREAQITAGLAPLIQAQHDQIAKILQASASFFEDLFPENWDGVDGLRIEVVEKIVLDEGIPLVAVPRASTVQMLVSAPDLKARRAIIRRRAVDHR
jgi:hypothetical protein